MTMTILAARPWAADALASAAAATASNDGPSSSNDGPSSSTLPPQPLQPRLATLGTLLYNPTYHAIEAAAAERQGYAKAQAKLRADRVIIAEHYRGAMEKGVEEISEKKEKEVGEMKANMLNELHALKPLALTKIVQDYQAALAKAGGGGGARLFFDGGAGNDGDEEEEEEGEAEGEEEGVEAIPYGLIPAGAGAGAKRGSTALVTPGSAAAAGAAKRMKKAARVNKQEEIRERLTNVLVGEEGHSAGAEDVAALLGMGEGGPDEAALVSEALAAINTDILGAKLAQAQRVAQREVEREQADRFNMAVEIQVNAALASLRQEMAYEFEAKLEEEVERQRVLLETDYDLQKKQFEEQLRAELGAAAGGGGGGEAGVVGVVEAAGKGGKKVKK